MDLPDRSTQQTYIQLLIDTLEKKKSILMQLMNITEQQESLISSDPFDDNLFEQMIEIKDDQIKNLLKLDEGFERVYESVKSILSTEKDRYKDQILSLKDLILDVTDLSIKLQALEKRNKAKIEFLFAQKRKDIKESRKSNRMVTNYYKSIGYQGAPESIFYDKKN